MVDDHGVQSVLWVHLVRHDGRRERMAGSTATDIVDGVVSSDNVWKSSDEFDVEEIGQ